MAKAMGSFRDSHALSSLSGPRVDVLHAVFPAKLFSIVELNCRFIVSWQYFKCKILLL
jgi:hypothetical protein